MGTLPSTLEGWISGRAPQGARGLKFISHIDVVAGDLASRPARGARIEISCWESSSPIPLVAPRKGRED